MRIERSICPLTMLVERSMLTMRIERSICPRGASIREGHLSETLWESYDTMMYVAMIL